MKQLWNIAHYEFLHVLKDPILIIIVFIAPLFYACLFGAVYCSAILYDVPLAIVDQDNSVLSREIKTAFANDDSFRIIEGIDSYEEMEAGMKTGTLRAAIVIPRDLELRIYQHRPAQVLAVYDASNLIWGFNSRKFIREVVNDFSIRHTAARLAGEGFSPREIENIVNSVECNVTAWYNPNYSYSNYLFMGLMMLAVHQLGLFGVCLAVTREKERQSWIHYIASAIPSWKIALGKALPYLIMNFFNYALVLWISSRFVQVKIEGSVGLLAVLGILYLMTITFAGFIISLYSSNSLQATRYLMLLSLPLFMISGYTWPRSYIPEFINYIALLFPSSWMVLGIRMVSLKELGLDVLWPTILALSILAVLAVYFAMNFKKERKAPYIDGVNINGGISYPRKINRLQALRQQIRVSRLS
ncbi:MAG: ABC transporter permease [Syntrophomonadaceae bacterium]|nr:ABC transporter permease [Syntrophomonadaceae bacterium]